MPRALSLKKSQAGPTKNQKPITQFFKNANISKTQNTVTQNHVSPEKDVGKQPTKRKAISPLTEITEDKIVLNVDQTHVDLESDTGLFKRKSPKKLKIENQNEKNRTPSKNGVNHKSLNKSPEKENGRKNLKSMSDFDSLISPIKLENENLLKPDSFVKKKEKSPLTPSILENVETKYQEIMCKSNESNHDSSVECNGKFSPNFYDFNVESSPNKTPAKNGTSGIKRSPRNGVSPKMCNGKSPLKCSKILEFQDVDGLFGDDWEEDIDIEQEIQEDLDLCTMQRCKIETVNRLPNKIELRLKNSNDNRGTCHIYGIWVDTPFHQGDTLSILAQRDPAGQFSVTNTSGLIALRPDRLVSSTSVVAGVFCKRKAVLQERWRGIDSANSAMTIGILVHELVQKALTGCIKSVATLEKEADKIIKESIQSLYDAGLSVEEAKTNIQMYITPLAEFMQMYMTDKPPSVKGQKDNWHGNINKVLDIEENLCCPQLGLKGKIDATLQVTIHDRKAGREKAVVPLELKSGRASVSAEHCGQLVLYGMMLSLQRGGDPTTDLQRGLLLYLKERVNLREVSCGYPERRDLMMLRNQLVQYLADGPNQTDPEQLSDIEEASVALQQRLPEPVHHHNACAKCPYLTVCSLHLWHTDGTTVSDTHPLSKLKGEALGHLSLQHIKYFLHWSALLKMEETGQMTKSPLHALWTDSVEKRSKRGTCAANLKLKSVEQSADRYLHIFNKTIANQGSSIENKSKGPQEGEFSIVSIDNRPWIAAGVVTIAKDNEIHILLERDLSCRLNKDTLYHIDTYESYATTVQNLTNLGVLVEDSDRGQRLRRLIIDKEAPLFDNKLPREVGRLGARLMKSLNIQQQRAVLRALAAKDYALLQGLPGTGKTQTISVLIQMLVALKQRVLVTAHTHSAVDTVLCRLPESLRIMRLGSTARVASKLLPRCEHQLADKCTTPQELEELYDSMEVVGVTCLGAAHAMLARTTFDICIVDEATQVLQCTVLRPLFAANRFVLVGDPEQLPPVVRSRAARRLGMEESLFHRLKSDDVTSTLQLQYRMNQALTDIANKVAYNNRLKCADEKVAQAKLNINIQKITRIDESWLERACSPESESAALFLDLVVKEIETKTDKSLTNVDEACVVIALVDALIEGGIKPADIGVISPFRDQVALLRRSLHKWSVEVSTVDQFQGRDKSVIIYSCAKKEEHNDKRVKEGEVLSDQRRLAVGVTRAKHKLIVVGNSRALQRYEPLKRLIDVCPCVIVENDVITRLRTQYTSLVL